MKNILGLVVVIVLVALGYYYFSQPAAAPTPADSNAGKMMASTSVETPEALALVGKWQSTDDAKFTREFKADGTVIDMYEGQPEATLTGTWGQVIKPELETYKYPAVGNATFLKLTFGTDELHFSVAPSTSPDSLSLTYLDRGNTLNFTRVK